jgi:hypothetical protein
MHSTVNVTVVIIFMFVCTSIINQMPAGTLMVVRHGIKNSYKVNEKKRRDPSVE